MDEVTHRLRDSEGTDRTEEKLAKGEQQLAPKRGRIQQKLFIRFVE